MITFFCVIIYQVSIIKWEPGYVMMWRLLYVGVIVWESQELLIFVCILDLEVWKSTWRLQSSYLVTMKELNGLLGYFDDYYSAYDDCDDMIFIDTIFIYCVSYMQFELSNLQHSDIHSTLVYCKHRFSHSLEECIFSSSFCTLHETGKEWS